MFLLPPASSGRDSCYAAANEALVNQNLAFMVLFKKLYVHKSIVDGGHLRLQALSNLAHYKITI